MAGAVAVRSQTPFQPHPFPFPMPPNASPVPCNLMQMESNVAHQHIVHARQITVWDRFPATGCSTCRWSELPQSGVDCLSPKERKRYLCYVKQSRPSPLPLLLVLVPSSAAPSSAISCCVTLAHCSPGTTALSFCAFSRWFPELRHSLCPP